MRPGFVEVVDDDNHFAAFNEGVAESKTSQSDDYDFSQLHLK